MSGKYKLSGKALKQKKSNPTSNSQVEFRKEEVLVDEFHTRECIYMSQISIAQARKSVESKETGFDTYLPSIREVFNQVLLPEFYLPDFRGMEKIDAIRELGALLNIQDLEMNLLLYWILETLVSVLKECQLINTSHDDQKMFIVWITFVLKQIATYGLSRSDLFRLLEKLIKKADIIVENYGPIPNPYVLMEKDTDYEQSIGSLVKDGKKSRDARIMSIARKSKRKDNSLTASMQNKIDQERKQRDNEFYLLIDQLYFIFGNRFKYEVIYDVFYTPEPIKVITICENILKPKNPCSSKRFSNSKENHKPRRSYSMNPKSGQSVSDIPAFNVLSKQGMLKWDTFQKASKSGKKDLIFNFFKSLTEQQKKDSDLEDDLTEKKQFTLLPLYSAVDSSFTASKWEAVSETPFVNKRTMGITSTISIFKQMESHYKRSRHHSF